MSSLCTDNYYPTPSSDLPSPAPSNHSNQSPQLSALVVNCQSLVAKKASFLNLLNSRHPDIVFGCESWLNASISNSELFPPNYTVYRRDLADGYGGVFLACHDNLITHEVTLTDTNCELIVCQVQFSNQCTLLACSIYRPPSSDELYLENLCQQLTNIRSRFPNSALWIGGDINLPDIKWCDGSIADHSNSLDLNNLFLDFLDNNALSQMVDSPTRGSSILDVFITDRPGLLESCHVVDGISDHEVVLVTSSITADLPPPTRRTIYLWSRTDLNLIRETAQSLCQRFTTTHSTSTPIDILWNDFMSICNTCMDLVPTKLSSTKHHQPWINSHIKRLTRKKQRAYNHARSTNTEHDWARYKDIKRQCQYECRNSFNLYVSNLIDPNSNAVSKRLWSYIKSKRLDHTGVSTLKHQGSTYSNSQEKANLLAGYFSSVFTNEDVSHIPDLSGETLPSIPQIVVHSDGVAQLLSNIKVNKASGPDNLQARLLQEVALEISPALTVIFQASLEQGALPNIWKSAAVVPIYKKGSRSDLGNYRPVSLTCICCKILEHIVFSSISKHLQNHEVLCDGQHGFRQKRSCESQLITTINDFAKCLNEKGQCDVLILDFRKAFDKVPHARLFKKLDHYGIHGALLHWLKSFLTNRSQHVVLDNQKSHPTPVTSGVPRGTVLPPLLFLLYINDLPSRVRSRVRLYADDVLLYSYIKSETDCHTLQEDLDALVEWARTWQMEFNPSKCEFLQITNKMNPTVYNYHIEATPIVQVEHTKYLGVTISRNLSWNEHIQRITNKAKQVNNFLYRNLRECPTHIKSGCYKIMVRPVIEYAASVWDPYTLSNINKLESIQRTAARFCFNNFSRFSSVTNMLTSLNLPSLQARRTQAKLNIFYKIINGHLDVPTDDLTPKLSSLRNGYYYQPMTLIDAYKFAFFPSTIKLWNQLPANVINSPTPNQFCNNLSNFYDHTCVL